jgi:hypothetical protein
MKIEITANSFFKAFWVFATIVMFWGANLFTLLAINSIPVEFCKFLAMALYLSAFGCICLYFAVEHEKKEKKVRK